MNNKQNKQQSWEEVARQYKAELLQTYYINNDGYLVFMLEDGQLYVVKDIVDFIRQVEREARKRGHASASRTYIHRIMELEGASEEEHEKLDKWAIY